MLYVRHGKYVLRYLKKINNNWLLQIQKVFVTVQELNVSDIF